MFEAELAVGDELKFWLLSWGAKAEVLEPQSLRAALQAEARGIAGKYAER